VLQADRKVATEIFHWAEDKYKMAVIPAPRVLVEELWYSDTGVQAFMLFVIEPQGFLS
jgi:hypothetical protein